MNKKQVINQLQSLRADSLYHTTCDDLEDYEIWNNDIKALDIAIEYIEKYMKD